jgi:hypothetical protein
VGARSAANGTGATAAPKGTPSGKKSKTGIKTPKQEVDLIRQRLKSIQEELQ